jgi:hypothetical protein
MQRLRLLLPMKLLHGRQRMVRCNLRLTTSICLLLLRMLRHTQTLSCPQRLPVLMPLTNRLVLRLRLRLR